MRIVVAVDLAAPNMQALVARAAAFTGAVSGRLDLLYVLPADGAGEAAAREGLGALMAGVPEGVRGELRLPRGTPVEQIALASEHAHALVVGPRPPGALERLLLGTVAARVIRQARCAVLVPRQLDKPPATYAEVGLGLDPDAPTAPWLAAEAGRWASRLGARVHAMCADPLGMPWIPDAKVRHAAELEWRRAREPRRQQVLALLADRAPGLEAEAEVIAGEADSALVTASSRFPLLMVGTREREGVVAMLLGSVAEQVVQHAACDVLTIPTGAKAAGLPGDA
jgi:nucleotide-binding universal stress UspA family protein